jgi:hypothetical protein
MTHGERASVLWGIRRFLTVMLWFTVPLTVIGIAGGVAAMAVVCGAAALVTAVSRAVVTRLFVFYFDRATRAGLSRNYINHPSSLWTDADYDKMASVKRRME